MLTWLVLGWIGIGGWAIVRVRRRQRAVEGALAGAIQRDRAYRGAGKLVRIVPGPSGMTIGRVPLGTGQHGFGVLRLDAMPFELRGEGLTVRIDAGAKLRVITHAATFDGRIASLPVGTKLVLLVPLADEQTRDEPITLVDPRVDLLGHLRAIRATSTSRIAMVVAFGIAVLWLAVLGHPIPAFLALLLLALDQLGGGVLIWTLCSSETS